MPETKRIVAVVCVLGLLTSFLPLFNVSPAALGKTEWSACDILKLLASKPNPLESLLQPGLLRLWIAYALLAGGLLLLWLPQYLTPVFMCTMVSLMMFGGVFRYHYSYSRISETQTGWHRGTLITNPKAYVLPGLLVFLPFVLMTESKLSQAKP